MLSGESATMVANVMREGEGKKFGVLAADVGNLKTAGRIGSMWATEGFWFC